jgi:hypothetical protein
MSEAMWLEGGPFLEFSFFLELKEEKKKAVQELINKLSNVTNKIEIVDENINDLINSFEKGYLYDDEKQHYRHSVTLRLFITISRRRKATLFIEFLSPNTLLVNFWIYGSVFDAPEWEQIGIKENEFDHMTNFLLELFQVYDFIIGSIAIEDDVTTFIDSDNIPPNQDYDYKNINSNLLNELPLYFIKVIWNERYGKLDSLPYESDRINNSGILLTIRDYNRLDN